MVRKVIGIIAGYVAMVVCVMVSFSVAYIIMGADNAYLPNSYEVSMLWIFVSAILGLFAAMIGGFVCLAIAKDALAVKVLAGLVLVLGLAMGIYVMTAERSSEVRTGDVTNAEAMQKSQQPVWVAFLNPFIGALGVVVGGGVKRD